MAAEWAAGSGGMRRRSFAWTRAGSPRKGFVLEAAGVLEAERRLVELSARG